MKLKKKYLFGTNTKMYKTPSEICSYIKDLKKLTEKTGCKDFELFVIPPFTALNRAVEESEGKIMIGAQNVAVANGGQHTGEISPNMLVEDGVYLAMIGHSERRHDYKENDFDEEKRVSCALENGMRVLLCVGEDAVHKQYGIQAEQIGFQLKIALASVTKEQALNKLWIAYEPTWAIGANGTPASAEYANEIHGIIKDVLNTKFGVEVGNNIAVLYGGSVNNDNATKLALQSNIDGLFIGRSALDANNFINIITSVLEARNER